MMKYILLIFSLPIALSLTAQQTPPADSNLSYCLRKANGLLDEALNFMEKNYYRKTAIDWSLLARSAREKLSSAENCNDVYDILSGCFRELNEPHSFIMPPERSAIYNNDKSVLQKAPSLTQLVGDITSEILPDGIAYLSVPWVSTTDSTICAAVADSLQQLIASLDEKNPRGWIVDLRKNTGGNCWPMLAGIGPLLGNGICGYFVNASEKVPIIYCDGAALQGKNLRCMAGRNYMVKSRAPIAVLTGNRTISAGEIIALAFRGMENVYFFGTPTAGYTTANATYALSNKATLVLTVCKEADRHGRICEGSIVPDHNIGNKAAIKKEGPDGAQDEAKAAAVMWLTSK